ncbi:MAG TPA: ribosome small subunit-dependent GTPase A [Paenalcaligenes sp.]|nr:ribosome small subunit-dependent GTPase A [Paenalcaligenes sp.]
MSANQPPLKGRIIATFGRNFIARCCTSAQQYQCYTRGKRTGVAIGDYVLLTPQGDQQAAIEKTLERKNLLYRSDNHRSKLFAANFDRLLFVLAPEPDFSLDLAGRAYTAAINAGVEMHIILNKADLPTAEQARKKLQPLQGIDIPIIETSIHHPEQLKNTLLPLLKDKSSLLLGQSAMGKSSILNVLVPDAQAQTRAHSQALGTGRHTTTDSRLYDLPNQWGYIIDSPGFQSFGLAHLELEHLLKGFPDFYEALQNCRFYNCTHRHEPGCGILAAKDAGHINPQRYQLYCRLIAELEARPAY